MDSSAVPGFIPSLKEPKGLFAAYPVAAGLLFQGGATGTTSSRLDHGHALGRQFNELTYYIVPETYAFLSLPLRHSGRRPDGGAASGFLDAGACRRARLVRQGGHGEPLPQEILPGDLIAGARFNVQTSIASTEKEAKRVRSAGDGQGRRAGPGQVVPRSRLRQRRRHQRAPDPRLCRVLLNMGWKGIHADLEANITPLARRNSRRRGAQLRAMMTAATMPRDLAAK